MADHAGADSHGDGPYSLRKRARPDHSADHSDHDAHTSDASSLSSLSDSEGSVQIDHLEQGDSASDDSDAYVQKELQGGKRKAQRHKAPPPKKRAPFARAASPASRSARGSLPPGASAAVPSQDEGSKHTTPVPSPPNGSKLPQRQSQPLPTPRTVTRHSSFIPQPSPTLDFLFTRIHGLVSNARIEATRDEMHQVKSQQCVEEAVVRLPTRKHRSSLCLTMNRYSAFCASPAIDVPAFPITPYKIAIFLVRATDTPIGASFRALMPQPSTYPLPLANNLDGTPMGKLEGDAVTRELATSWAEALGYAQLATRSVWMPILGDSGLSKTPLLSEPFIQELLSSFEPLYLFKKSLVEAPAQEPDARPLSSSAAPGALSNGHEMSRQSSSSDGASVTKGEIAEPSKKKTKWVKGGKSVNGPPRVKGSASPPVSSPAGGPSDAADPEAMRGITNPGIPSVNVQWHQYGGAPQYGGTPMSMFGSHPMQPSSSPFMMYPANSAPPYGPNPLMHLPYGAYPPSFMDHQQQNEYLRQRQQYEQLGQFRRMEPAHTGTQQGQFGPLLEFQPVSSSQMALSPRSLPQLQTQLPSEQTSPMLSEAHAPSPIFTSSSGSTAGTQEESSTSDSLFRDSPVESEHARADTAPTLQEPSGSAADGVDLRTSRTGAKRAEIHIDSTSEAVKDSAERNLGGRRAREGAAVQIDDDALAMPPPSVPARQSASIVANSSSLGTSAMKPSTSDPEPDEKASDKSRAAAPPPSSDASTLHVAQGTATHRSAPPPLQVGQGGGPHLPPLFPAVTQYWGASSPSSYRPQFPQYAAGPGVFGHFLNDPNWSSAAASSSSLHALDIAVSPSYGPMSSLSPTSTFVGMYPPPLTWPAYGTTSEFTAGKTNR